MPEAIAVVFADVNGPEILRRTVLDLGGEAVPQSMGDVQLSDGSAVVWVMLDAGNPPGIPSQEDADRYAALLGRPHAADSVLIISRSDGSKQVALRIIEELARRTPVIVDDDHGWITSVEDLLTFGAVNPDGLFNGPPGDVAKKPPPG